MRTTAAMWMLFLWMFLFPVVMGCEDGSGSDDVDAADNIDTGSAANLDSGDTDDLQNSTDTGTLEGTDGGESDGGDFTPVAFVPDEACRMDELREGTIHGAFCAANEAYCNGSCFSTAGATDAGCELLTINVPNSEGMALDDTHLYFTSYNSVFRTHLSGYQTECVVGGLYFPDGVMRHNDMVYVGINDMFGITGIVRVGADGDDPMLIAENAYGGKNFQVADNTLFFTGMSNMDANLYAAPLAGGTTTEVFTEVMGTDGYAVMDGEVYVIGSNIMRASVDASTTGRRWYTSQVAVIYLKPRARCIGWQIDTAI